MRAAHDDADTTTADVAAAERATPRAPSGSGGTATVVLTAALIGLVVLLWAMLLQDDGPAWLAWLGALLLPGAAVWPLAHRLFRGVPAVVLPFALALGALLVAFLTWTLSSLHVLPFQTWSLWIVLAALAAACWIPPGLRRGLRDTAPGAGAGFLVLFVVALGAWSYVRGVIPAVDGLEKFMDYGFMTSLMRTDHLPALDPWLAGSDINYYYFGQFFYTLFVKLSLVPPAVGYNLALATTFAYLVTLAAAIGWQLSALRRGRPASVHVVSAAATAFFVAIAGNAHAFFFSPAGLGRGIVEALGLGSTADWFYPNSTRFIGYNPETTDKTIHEFPFYSFLVGDLHAHLVNTVFVLLFVGLLVQHVTRRAEDGADAAPASLGARLRAGARTLLERPLPLFGALALAVFLMGNYWDLVIYYVVLVGVLFVVAFASRERPSASVVGVFVLQQALVLVPFAVVSQPVPAALAMAAGAVAAALLLRVRDDRLTRDGVVAATTFALAHVFALTFSVGFEPISRRIAVAQAHTPLWQLAVLWGPQLLILLGGLVAFLRTRPLRTPRPAVDAVVVALGLCGAGLVLVPELVYVVDIYENGFARANTMFKLTYQASILLGIVVPFVLVGAWRAARRAWARRADAAPWGAVTALAAGLVAAATLVWYPFAAMPQVVPALADYRGLDGAAWMAASAPGTTGEAQYAEVPADDAAAIAWLNGEVTGQPVVVEAAGPSYTHFARISSYTGLPTVLGWETHEWLWRTSAAQPDAYGSLIAPRAAEIEAFYTRPAETAAEFIDRHSVVYVVIGELERSRYPGLDEAGIEALGEVVFRSGTTAIVRVG